MKIRRGFKYKLKKPKTKTRRLARRFAGCRRHVYNRGLEVQIGRLNNNEGLLDYPRLCALLIGWKNDQETSWLKEAPSHVLQQSLKDLDRAFKNFFAKRAGFPLFRKKGRRDSFRFPDPAQFKIDQENGRIFLPKLGWSRYHASRPMNGAPKNVTVTVEADGLHFSVQTEMEVEAPARAEGSMIGLDVGVARFATLSDGTVFEPLDSYRRHEKNLRRRQRGLARKREAAKRLAEAERAKNGGKGPLKIVHGSDYRKAGRGLARTHKKIADCRRDLTDKVAAEIGKNHAVVVVEDLGIMNMAKSAAGTLENPGRNVKAKSGLNKAILDQGWGMFVDTLARKLAAKGGELVKVPPHHTSQKCPECGHVDQANRKTQADFKCVSCGYSNNADVVGALNILTAGQAVVNARGGHGAQGQPMKREPAEGTGAL